MRYFVCLLDRNGEPISSATRRTYESLPRSRGLAYTWLLDGDAAVLTAWDNPFGEPLVIREGDDFAAGLVRLDNRRDVERLTCTASQGLSNLSLVYRLIAQGGPARVRDLLGDFAFVIWYRHTRTAIAATDPFNVRRLFRADRGGVLAFSSRAEALVTEERYDPRYLAERVALCTPTEGVTVYSGVSALPAATVTVEGDVAPVSRRYWTPDEFEPRPDTSLSRSATPSKLCEISSLSPYVLASAITAPLGLTYLAVWTRPPLSVLPSGWSHKGWPRSASRAR